MSVDALLRQHRRISVVIPCFNAERWVGEAIESCLAQARLPAEIVVVDDGSTDASAEVVARYGDRVRYVYQANAGGCRARNAGFSLSTGDTIQFLDADDVLHPSRFSLMLDAWDKEPAAEFVATSYRSFHAGEISAVEFAGKPVGSAEAEIRDDALSVNYLPCAGLFRKSFLQSIGPWDETLTRWVDLEYHARIASRRGALIYLNAPLYGYRQHDGPRISSHNRKNTNLDEALRSLNAAEVHFAGGALLPPQRKDYFFPFYVQLARGYAKAGDQPKFALTLRKAASVSAGSGFRRKARAAQVFARLLGVRAASGVMECLLPPTA